MTWVLLHFELMTVHFTEGKHITLPNQPEGERVQWGEKKRIPKQGSKGSQWSPDAVCLKAAKTLARVPHTTREGHRGLLSATGGSGEPSQNICETKSTGRGEENYSPGGRKCSSIIQFMFLAGWHSPGMSLWKSFLETQLSFASFHSVLAVAKSPECSHCWKHCKNCECPPRTGCEVSIECQWLKVSVECLKREFQYNVNLNLNVSDSMPQILVSISKLLLCHWIVLKNVSEVQNIFQYFFQKLWGFFVFLSVKNWKELLTSDC